MAINDPAPPRPAAAGDTEEQPSAWQCCRCQNRVAVAVQGRATCPQCGREYVSG